MPLNFLAQLAIQAALLVLSALLARRSKMSVRAEPLRVDPPTPGEPVPLAFGTVKLPLKFAAVWAWRAEPIYKKERLFGSPAFTVGKVQVCTRYWITAPALLCHGPVVLTDLVVDGKSLTRAGANFGLVEHGGTMTLDFGGLLGGDFANGGVYGPVRVYNGEGRNTPDALATLYEGGLDADNTPDWRHYAHLVFADTWIGNSATLPPLHAVVTRTPLYPGPYATVGHAGDAGGDANPGAVLWELLTHPHTGLGLTPDLLDGTSFGNAIDTFRGLSDANGAMGVSFTVDRATPAAQVIEDVLRVIDASLYTDPSTGKLALALHRAPAVGEPASLLRIDESVASACRYTSPQPASVCNQVELAYVDRARGFQRNVVSAKNAAAIQAQGRVITETVEMLGVSTEAMAARLAARELRQLTTPLAVVTLTCDRRPAGLHEGRTFRLSWAAYGLSEVVFRCTAIDHGTPDDPRVTIEAVQDVYSLPSYNADVVTSTPWTDPTDAAGFLVPEVEETATTGDFTGTLALTITDPQSRVTLVEFNTQTGRGAPSGWTADTAPYQATVTLDPKHLSYIGWRVTYTLPGGGTSTLEGAVAFEADISTPADALDFVTGADGSLVTGVTGSPVTH